MTDPGPPPKRLPVVLLVDDEPLVLESIGWELRESCEVHTATSAAEADLRIAERTFDAIVCDHMLDGEQGIDFLVRMQEQIPATRRILMTGYMNAEFIARSTAIAGLSVCLVKPLKTAEIARAIRAALAS